MNRVVSLLTVMWVCCACGPSPVVSDASIADAGQDAGVADAGPTDDAGAEDAGALDAGNEDAGVPDAGPPDAGSVDAGAPDAGPVDAGNCPLPSGIGPVFRLRAMAANLTSGNLQSYDPGHGARIMMGAAPDIVMIQEFNFGNSTPAAIDAFVAATFDGGFSSFRGAGSIPNGVISRWPIVATGEWNGQSPDRKLTWAKVDLPGPHDVLVISVHMPTSSPAARNLDALAIINQLDASVPETDYVLVGGDFNTDVRSEVSFSTFAARLHTDGPHPADQYGVEGTNGSRTKPYDNVLASPCLARQQGPTIIGASIYDAGLVIDTQVYAPLSELAPAEATDSIAPNMQHMGVLKDFFIQP